MFHQGTYSTCGGMNANRRGARRGAPFLLGLALVVTAATLGRAQEPAYAPIGATTPMLDVRQMHGAAVLGDYLYVVGGTTGKEGYASSCEVAHIRPDGLLDSWQNTTPLPTPRCYISNSTVALNDTIYVVGGFDNRVTGPRNAEGFNARTVYWARPTPDGQLGPWQESPPFPGEGISCLTVVATPQHLYVLGGLKDDNTPTANVYMGTIDADGGIADWKAGPPLPIPLWFHNAVTVGGRVWVWGGLSGPTNQSTSDRIFSSPILKDGSLGDWREETTKLPVPYYSAANASAGPYVMAFCPRLTGGTTTTDVWFTQVGDHGMSTWNRFRTHLTAHRYMAAAPDYRRGTIYIPGGRVSPTQLEDKVFYFTLSKSARQEEEGPARRAETTVALSSQPAQPSQYQYTFQAAAAPNLPQGAVPGFLPYDEARRYALGPPSRPLMLYFTLPNVPPCEKQNQILRDPRFAALSREAAFAWIPVQEYPQLVQQLGVFRVPSWVLYDARGNSHGRVSEPLTLDQLQLGIASAR